MRPRIRVLTGGGLAADVAGFEADAIHDPHVDAVRDGVAR